ncbi:MAG: hypothetical protein AAF531_16130 [Actinomycetota bacterium]
MAKPWLRLTAEAVAEVPAQLGVFQLAEPQDGSEVIIRIGYAGGRDSFGMRSALGLALADARATGEDRPVLFRYELTHAYLTRWEELLMVQVARHGSLPTGNRDHPHAVGRLRLG